MLRIKSFNIVYCEAPILAVLGSVSYGSATLGRYGTAVEAALAYARHVQSVRAAAVAGGGVGEGGGA